MKRTVALASIVLALIAIAGLALAVALNRPSKPPAAPPVAPKAAPDRADLGAGTGRPLHSRTSTSPSS